MAVAKHFVCMCLLLAGGVLCKEAAATRSDPSNNEAEGPLLGNIREARNEAQETISQVRLTGQHLVLFRPRIER